MLARPLTPRKLTPVARQVLGDSPQVLAEALEEGVNLAVWRRQLPAPVAGFADTLLSLAGPLAEAISLELEGQEAEPNLRELAGNFSDLDGYDYFVADVAWLLSAYACLLDAKRIGLRLRVLDKAMCPRFHVDHVPLRLITTYAGTGSQWLREGAIDRARLGDPAAEPQAPARIQQLASGEVALFKGEKWLGNEGYGIVHRSPQLADGERRLILTLDWLA
ncbi:DUF1826 domain-containing protein [Pseudomonas cavernicola]|uniref:DUF1826 domain-containing protein n=1 Tax=Pseudomonas cavernicola TaxID=2320866 RepID=A0A418XJX3_9PSED|nr:DUF1826 domain-containing protein [Pseudomonas cavernicola]RJG12773.1 DUF1826 domain-containing protein [Pseudomonas cavernicola]